MSSSSRTKQINDVHEAVKAGCGCEACFEENIRPALVKALDDECRATLETAILKLAEVGKTYAKENPTKTRLYLSAASVLRKMQDNIGKEEF